jgi:hypothetical protein
LEAVYPGDFWSLDRNLFFDRCVKLLILVVDVIVVFFGRINGDLLGFGNLRSQLSGLFKSDWFIKLENWCDGLKVFVHWIDDIVRSVSVFFAGWSYLRSPCPKSFSGWERIKLNNLSWVEKLHSSFLHEHGLYVQRITNVHYWAALRKALQDGLYLLQDIIFGLDEKEELVNVKPRDADVDVAISLVLGVVSGILIASNENLDLMPRRCWGPFNELDAKGLSGFHDRLYRKLGVLIWSSRLGVKDYLYSVLDSCSLLVLASRISMFSLVYPLMDEQDLLVFIDIVKAKLLPFLTDEDLAFLPWVKGWITIFSVQAGFGIFNTIFGPKVEGCNYLIRWFQEGVRIMIFLI